MRIHLAFGTLCLLAPFSAAAAFSDVPSAHPHAAAIEYVRQQGIVAGYPDGTYRPDAVINRAEFAKIIIGATLPSNAPSACIMGGDIVTGAITDVPKGQWYTQYVCELLWQGFAYGYPDGTFRPDREINAVEAAKILSNALDVEVTFGDDVWYRPYIIALGLKHAIPTTITSFDQPLTRGQMAEMIYRLHAGVTTLPTQTYASLAGSQGGDATIDTAMGGYVTFLDPWGLQLKIPEGWSVLLQSRYEGRLTAFLPPGATLDSRSDSPTDPAQIDSQVISLERTAFPDEVYMEAGGFEGLGREEGFEPIMINDRPAFRMTGIRGEAGSEVTYTTIGMEGETFPIEGIPFRAMYAITYTARPEAYDEGIAGTLFESAYVLPYYSAADHPDTDDRALFGKLYGDYAVTSLPEGLQLMEGDTRLSSSHLSASDWSWCDRLPNPWSNSPPSGTLTFKREVWKEAPSAAVIADTIHEDYGHSYDQIEEVIISGGKGFVISNASEDRDDGMSIVWFDGSNKLKLDASSCPLSREQMLEIASSVQKVRWPIHVPFTSYDQDQ